MSYPIRTTYCGLIYAKHAQSTITINGWVKSIRNHGGLLFLIIRDRTGIVQVVIDEQSNQELQTISNTLHPEYCVAITGKVTLRSTDTINPELSTGEIEIRPTNIVILSKSNVPVFTIEEEKSNADEDTRLKYRYLDLRSGWMQKNIQLRHSITQSFREYLNTHAFLEIETPTLICSTPEGARDFLVPSRLQQGKFYALAQSPQIYKQLLMISGFDRYYQFAHCFRDEDLRGDRQPEHTQLDIEMSFVTKNDVLSFVEGLFGHVFQQILNIDLPPSFQRISYLDAMNTYGTDKPDARYQLHLQDIHDIANTIDFGVFKTALQLPTGTVKCLVIPQAASLMSRKNIDALEALAKKFGAKGLAWTKYTSATEGFTGGVAKFLAPHTEKIVSTLALEANDMLFFAADTWHTTCTVLGAIRREMAHTLGYIPTTNMQSANDFSFLWVEDFPLFEWDETNKRWAASHHMFTMPKQEYLDTIVDNPATVKGELYDLVCNGVELASGSVRIHDYELQQKIFQLLGMSQEEIHKKFGFFIEALQYGAPPHAGIAPGLDRLLMIITGAHSIRDTIAFPKNTQGSSPLDNSPSPVETAQLQELSIQISHKK